jgi:hypothetical protein
VILGSIVSALALTAAAQTVNSSLEGVVEDPSGAIVPDAEAILTNLNPAALSAPCNGRTPAGGNSKPTSRTPGKSVPD